MKKLILLLLFIPLVFSCSSDDDDLNTEMALNIINEFSQGEIERVYWTNNGGGEVIIPKGSSRKFVLTDVPDESLLDVTIVMKCLGRSSKTTRLTVYKGQTTTITAQDNADLGVEACCSCYDLILS